MRGLLTGVVMAIALASAANERVHAQTNERPAGSQPSPVVSSPGSHSCAPEEAEAHTAQQPAGPPPTPRHTGIKALVTGIFTDLKYLPSKENLIWAGTGGGLALAVHPLDDDVNEALVGNAAAENFFKPGEILGEL